MSNYSPGHGSPRPASAAEPAGPPGKYWPELPKPDVWWTEPGEKPLAGARTDVPRRPPRENRARLRPKVLALIVALTAAVTGGGIAVGVAVSSAPSLAGKTPQQILRLALAAASRSGAVTTERTLLWSRPGAGLSLLRNPTETTYVGPNGAWSESSTSSPFVLAVVVSGGRTYIKPGPALLTAVVGRSHSGLEGHWLLVPASSELPSAFSQGAQLTLANLISATTLGAPLSETASSASVITLSGRVGSSATAVGAPLATLEVSTAAPFYPVRLSIGETGGFGTEETTFGDWGKTKPLPSVTGALPLQTISTWGGPISSGPISSGPFSSGPISSRPISIVPISIQPISSRPISIRHVAISGSLSIVSIRQR